MGDIQYYYDILKKVSMACVVPAVFLAQLNFLVI